jgi:ABC-2 type transport system ATP-binding protein
MSIVIQTKDLTRVYKSYQKPEGFVNSLKAFVNRQHVSKIAVDKTNLEIESGQIIGLVGANGAGKTTLLKMLSGLVTPTSGEAKVLGFTPWERTNEFLRQISILLGQKNQLWWDIAPADSFALLARIYDLDPIQARARYQQLAEMLQCTHVLQTQLRRLSLGERMKMEIIGALLHEPRVLFLDEPTIGLDIVAQETIRNFLGDYVKDKGPTIILTSHYMDDIAKLADKLLLISKGVIVYQGTVDDFVVKANTELAQNEEVDFEEVIRRFLETESRVR